MRRMMQHKDCELQPCRLISCDIPSAVSCLDLLEMRRPLCLLGGH